MYASALLGTADSATVAAVEDGAEKLKDTIMGVGTVILPLAASVLALTLGWRYVRRFF